MPLYKNNFRDIKSNTYQYPSYTYQSLLIVFFFLPLFFSLPSYKALSNSSSSSLPIMSSLPIS